MLFEAKNVDRHFYWEKLDGFLPRRIIDCHTHVWLSKFRLDIPIATRGPTWPLRVAEDNSLADLQATYELLLPGHAVTPVVFGMPERNYDLDRGNDWVSTLAAGAGLPALIVTQPA